MMTETSSIAINTIITNSISAFAFWQDKKIKIFSDTSLWMIIEGSLS